MIRCLVGIVTFFSFYSLYSQNTFEVELNWEGEFRTVTRFEEELKFPAVDLEYDKKGRPVSIFRKRDKLLRSNAVSVSIVNFETEPASSFDRQFILDNGLDIPVNPEYSFKRASDRGDYFIGGEIFPYVKQNNELKRVKKIYFSSTLTPLPFQTKAGFVTSSVLGNGQWYKVRISTTGMYRLDRSFLEGLGINTSGLNPDHIHVYGNATGMLPEDNSIDRPDDLVKNAIEVVGGGDGSFDANDYIVFYGVGPDEIVVETGGILAKKKHLYDAYSYYYISVNSSTPPLRISGADLTNLPSTHIIAGSDQVVTHEKDDRNLIKSGKRWYGEEFDFQLEYTFNFSLPGIQTEEQIKLFTSLAYANSGGSNLMRVYLNNSQVQSYPFTVVGGNNFANRSFQTTNHNVTGSSASVKMVLERTNPSTIAWLDKIELNYRRSLSYGGGQVTYRDLRTVGIGNIAQYTLSGSIGNMNVWEITDPHIPGVVNGTVSGSTFSFRFAADSLRQFVAFTHSSLLVPEAVGRVENQNLHALSKAEYLIVSHPDYLAQANRLADLHRADGMAVHVVTTSQVYNEFSAGKADPVAIRFFAKMFYDRASGNPADMPKYLCLFGDGTYDPKDRVANNNNRIVTYQSDNSENVVTSLTSDDFFGLLDDSESFSGADGLDLGVGRIIASTTGQAKMLVDKIVHYKNNGSDLFASTQSGTCGTENDGTYGDWRLWVTHIADDEDGGQFVLDHEGYVANYSAIFPELNYDKIYLDAFTQITTSGGQRYPDVPPLINSRIERGTVLMNYVGHGGETGLALERIITIPQIQSWRNIDKLPLFVSATCEFTRFDDPSRLSAGEYMYLSDKGGAISLMTTTRPVYINVNSIVGGALYDYVFNRDANFLPIPMGETLMMTKNNSTSDANRRSFMLLGDPALRLSLPKVNVVVDSVNGKAPSVEMDTLRSLSKVTIKAHVEDENGNPLTGLNGVAVPSVFDKPLDNQTLAQDPGSPQLTFQTQKNILYRGKSTVTNGAFEFTFVVPKDINYSFGNGKISLYANSDNIDGAGSDFRVIVGGVNPDGLDDSQGPDVNLFMNDDKFVSGGMTNENPVLIAKLFDENGINAVGNGIGHDITAILDGKTSSPIVLNDYYEAELDSYQEGAIRYQFENLDPGRHTLTFKAWDVNNNSSEVTMDFVVVENKEITIDHVLNYPNPFTTHTEFFFEHNQVDASLEVQVQIFTISGKLVKTINEPVTTCGFRSNGIAWDGRDDFGDQLAKGVYVYRLSVKAPDGTKADKTEKLVLLK